jgi:GDP-4-dehydro-6-deoxy-D-mannose reductase
MKILITGAGGFIGGFLSKHCSDAGHSVLGLGITELEEPWIAGRYELCDIRDSARLYELVSTFRPDRIFHLAAQSYPTVSLQKPQETMDVNVCGTVNLYECIRRSGLKPIVVVACSSAEYGPVASENLPVRETHPLSPLHPYGVSKVAQDLLAAQYFYNYSIPSVRIRIFNTTGPSKIGDVCSDLTKRAVEIELGLRRPSLRVGNLTTRRALLDVRDMVRALWLAAECCQPGEVYNVGGTQIYSVQEVIDILRNSARVAFDIEQDPELMRACDEPVIAGDISKFQSRSNWAPEISLTRTVEEMLDWWRATLADHAAVAGRGGVGAAMAREERNWR